MATFKERAMMARGKYGIKPTGVSDLSVTEGTSFKERAAAARKKYGVKEDLQGTMGTRGVPTFKDIYKYIVQETRKGNWDTAQNTERKYWERMTDDERKKLNDYYRETHGMTAAPGSSALTSANVAKIPTPSQKNRQEETETAAEREQREEAAKNKMWMASFRGPSGFLKALEANRELKTVEEEKDAADPEKAYGGKEGYALGAAAKTAQTAYEESYRKVQLASMQLREADGDLAKTKDAYVAADVAYRKNPTEQSLQVYNSALTAYQNAVKRYNALQTQFGTEYADYKGKADAAGKATAAYNDHIAKWEKELETAEQDRETARLDFEAYGRMGADATGHQFTYASQEEARRALEAADERLRWKQSIDAEKKRKEFYALQWADDFDEVSKQGETKHNIINSVALADPESKEGKVLLDFVSADSRYNYLTDTERKIYNYLFAKYGAARAEEEIKFLTDELNRRQGTADAQADLQKNGVSRFLSAAEVAAESGLDRWAQGVKQAFTTEVLPQTATAYEFAERRENAPKVGKAAMDITAMTTQQIPNMIIAAATAGLGTAAPI